ncbi:UDP-N-acetylmuramoyl-L-alanyl-D-glutamate--2,6-diaminopimelate ligase [Nocardioides campestrisoli]|uniref:UDP-N-acetylmuramoyl-L-alanyl-D-glutamate--2, 6-diaminopimelate ligase n=1 Tax=Nocardioides campestrisoli TaxID=2736757 RepID=UPI0015E6F4C3|nr:UDP-N-acetylmuramoyl-L-alanyl-D-glutamate--2,6-diaminopimelate ligase [Nocardioides campestrisoli]
MVTPGSRRDSVQTVVGSATTRPSRPPRSALGDLADWLATHSAPRLTGEPRTVVTGLTLSSQRVRPGDLYVALPGARAHGADYAADAVASGAVAVLTDEAGALRVQQQASDVPLLVVPEPRRLLGGLSAHVYGDPATSMAMIGVTGTQGKTTTTRLAEAGLQASGTRAAVVGTVGTRMVGEDVPTSLTTPEAPDLQALFAVMREREVAVCAMEVSSHALVLGRVDGTVFDVTTFLNLGRDHLDFHADVEEYFAAKASLFTPERARLALVNLDDGHGRRLAESVTIPLRTFSAAGAEADWRAVEVTTTAHGSTFVVEGPGGLRLPAGVPLAGDFNVSNALAAIASCAEAGFDPAAVAAGIAEGPGVPGRLEDIDEGQSFAVVVDYAHKPDAVEAALRTLRPLTEGRLLVVIGAGGDRDPGKRPLMGEIAARLADVLVVTDDNPRSEEPAAIRAAVLAGAGDGGAEVLEVGERRTAIRTALELAGPGDIVLVAGKGHESGQEVAGVVHPFDDRDVVREELRRL